MPWSSASDCSGEFAQANLVREKPGPPSNRVGDFRFPNWVDAGAGARPHRSRSEEPARCDHSGLEYLSVVALRSPGNASLSRSFVHPFLALFPGALKNAWNLCRPSESVHRIFFRLPFRGLVHLPPVPHGLPVGFILSPASRLEMGYPCIPYAKSKRGSKGAALPRDFGRRRLSGEDLQDRG